MGTSTSLVIPARNETYLNQTIQDALLKASGDIEVIAVLDGYWPDPLLTDPRVRYIHRGAARGMRAAINAGVALSQGDFILKADGHCMFADGYDEVLAADCDTDWVVVPTRKRLDAENWCVIEDGRPDIDYMYLAYPTSPEESLHGKLWEEKNRDPALKDVLIDDLMSAQGSAWFMRRSYFDFLELMDEASYGTFSSEFQEIALKAQLSGGQVKVNKKTSYAHLHKSSRGYPLDSADRDIGRAHTRKWLDAPGVAWPKAYLHLSWLVEKFAPVPSWPEDRALWGAQAA